jgi:hypothetical protein
MRCFGFVLALMLVLPGSSYAQNPTVRLIEIGTPEPDRWFTPVALNSHGVVLGMVGRNQDISRLSAYTWTRKGGFRFILNSAEPRDINDRGTIVGISRVCGSSGCEARGFMWTPSRGVRDLGDFWPHTINDKGSMAGYCQNRDFGSSPCARIGGRTHVFSGFDNILDINEHNVVVGFTHGANGVRAVMWSPGLGLRDLDGTSELGGVAFAINDGGMIVGEGKNPATTWTRNAAIWTPLGRAEFPDPGSIAYGISNRGWIVGHAEGHRPALWLLGPRLVLLPVPADAMASSFNAALHVNNAGHIAGHVLVDGQERALFWIVR